MADGTETLSQEERLAYVSLLASDPVKALRELLPEWFPKKMPWVHRGIVALVLRQSDFLLNFGPESWRDEDADWTVADLRKIEKHFVYRPYGQPEVSIKLFDITWAEDRPIKIDLFVSDKILTVMPRGFSKTTLYKGLIIFMILLQLCKFVVYLSEASAHAEAQLNDIRRELRENAQIQIVFGNIVPERSDVEKWTDGEFETKTGIFAVGRGRGGQVRGLNRRGFRPDKILFDDVEDTESVLTEAQRAKALNWFRSDVERARKLIGETTFYGLGTLLHPEALIPTLFKDPEWITLIFGAVDLDGDALWPEAMSLEKIDREKISYAATNSLSNFYREILSLFKADDDAKFKSENIIIHPADLKDLIAISLAMDPAISAKKRASHCTFAVTGIDKNARITVLDVYGKIGMTPRQQIDKYFEMSYRWGCTRHGIESIAYQQALIHLMKEEMGRKSRTLGLQAFFEITPITHGNTGKIPRIEGVLSTRYAAGYIRHQRNFPDLETALLDWPNSKVDFPDVVAMAITLLDEFAGLAVGAEFQDEALTPTIEYEIDGDFRSAP